MIDTGWLSSKGIPADNLQIAAEKGCMPYTEPLF